MPLTDASSIDDAPALSLFHRPASPAAIAFTDTIADRIEATEKRKRPRGPGERAKLTDACAAILGGLLLAASKTEGQGWCRRSMAKDSFTGAVSYPTAKLVLDRMKAAGLVERIPGIQYKAPAPFRQGEQWQGRQTRLRATPSLLRLAASHGVVAANVKTDWRYQYPPRAEPVAKGRAIIVRTHKARGGPDRELPIDPRDPAVKAMVAEVEAGNRLLAKARWSGCQPPSMCRTFRADRAGDWRFGGRWTMTGARPIQIMPKLERQAITINGGPVAEVDVNASHLRIVAALAGMPAIEGDVYALPGLHRDIVKAAVTDIFGLGKVPDNWSRRTRQERPAIAAEPFEPIKAALIARYPFLDRLNATIRDAEGHIATRLQGLEAEAMTHALKQLWGAKIPAVPIHDGLLLPASEADAAEEALRAGYRLVVGAEIQVTRSVAGPA